MAAALDPYYRWLGIPPDEQPPNHYRLLGVRPFEYDPAVIQRAANERVGQIEPHRSDASAGVVRSLLAEVSAAAACLLDRHQKAAYDHVLRQMMAGRSSASRVAAPATAPAATALCINASGTGTMAARLHARRRNRPAVIGVLAAVGIAAVVVIVLTLSDREPQERPQKRGASAVGVDQTEPEQGSSPTSGTERQPEGAGNPSTPGPRGASASPALDGPPADRTSASAAPPNESPTSDAAVTQVTSANQPAAATTPVPQATTVVRQGDVEVEIRSARIDTARTVGRLSSHTLALSDANERCLLLDVEIRNLGPSGTIRYVSWAGTTLQDTPARLTDEVGTLYRQLSTIDPESQQPPASRAKVATLTQRNFQAVSRAKEPVVVLFWAPWSESCRDLLPMIDHLSAEYGAAIKVGRFQVPDGTQPKTFAATPFVVRMQIDTIPYVLVFHRGRVVQRFRGPIGLGELEDALDALLPEKLPPHETIGPGGSFQDRLVFERPSDKAAFVKLELPEAAFGGGEPIEFVIPRTMIVEETGRSP